MWTTSFCHFYSIVSEKTLYYTLQQNLTVGYKTRLIFWANLLLKLGK